MIVAMVRERTISDLFTRKTTGFEPIRKPTGFRLTTILEPGQLLLMTPDELQHSACHLYDGEQYVLLFRFEVELLGPLADPEAA